MADDAAVLLVGPRQEARHVDEGDQRDVEGVACPHEPCRLLGGVDVEHASQDHRLVADDADRPAGDLGEATGDGGGVGGVHLEVVAVVDHRRDDRAHVVGLVGRVRQDVGELRAQPLGVVASVLPRWLLQVVGRQEAEQVLHVVQAGVLVCRDEVGHARLRGVAHGTTELFERDLFAGDGLDHIRAGDEHVAGLVDHEDEVRHRR